MGLQSAQLMAPICLLSSILGGAAPVQAKPVELIVGEFERAYEEAWNAANAARLTALFAKDVTIHTVSGKLLKGRDVIRADSEKRYRDFPNPPAIHNLTMAATYVTPDIIVTQGHSDWADGSHYIYTKVLRREGKRWLMVAMQVARPAAMALSKD